MEKKIKRLIHNAKISLSFILMLFLLLNFLTASFQKGNPLSNVKSSYAYNENLVGWINLSIVNESNSKYFFFNNQNITLKTLLEANELIAGADYTCSNSLCEDDYQTSDIGFATKEITLASEERALLGFKIINSQDFSSLKNLLLGINSSAAESCNNQLQIDLLDDGIIDWENKKVSNNFCIEKNYGCYSSGALIADYINMGEKYCGKINLSRSPGLFAGAKLSGSGEATFTITFNEENSCDIVFSSSGELNCDLNTSIETSDQYTFCLNKKSGDGNYKIYFEDNSPCGYIADVSADNSMDFSIFASPKKYAAIESQLIPLNDSTTINEVESYLSEIYASDCSNGCVIPIKITSKTAQKINLTSATIIYNGVYSNNTLYNLEKFSAKISFPFTLLNLDNSGFKVPGTTGKSNLSLKFGDTEITKLSINVLSVPIITSFSPLEAGAGINTDFNILASGNITYYVLDFGDNTTEITTTNNLIRHNYEKIGEYEVQLWAYNSQGSTNKNFTLNVVSPKNYINSSLQSLTKKVANLTSQANSFTGVNSAIKNILNLSATETKIASLKTRYNSAGEDPEAYIAIAQELSSIELPLTIKKGNRFKGRFFLSGETLSIADIKTLTSEESSIPEQNLKNAIFEWYLNSLNVNLTSEEYSAVYYPNNSEFLLAYIKLEIKPTQNTGDSYVIINAPSSAIEAITPVTLQEISSTSSGFSTNLDSAKTLEFTIKTQINILEPPIYITPKLSSLKLVANLTECNNNGKCESGENTETCPNDCKSKKPLIIWLIIIFVIFLILYIICQEWYKRRYEDYLFKDKNDLYNLIYYIKNSEKTGVSRNDMNYKLKERGWDSEQITFAYKKFKGKRTGMWEIPIFKSFENRKVAEEIKAREDSKKQTEINPPNRPLIRPGRIPPVVSNMGKMPERKTFPQTSQMRLQETARKYPNPQQSSQNNPNRPPEDKKS